MLDAIEERVQVKIDHERRVISDELACARDGLMGRATRSKAEARLGEVRVEDGGEHLQQSLLDQPIQRRRHPQGPHPTRGDLHPAHGLRSLGARVELATDVGPLRFQPRP